MEMKRNDLLERLSNACRAGENGKTVTVQLAATCVDDDGAVLWREWETEIRWLRDDYEIGRDEERDDWVVSIYGRGATMDEALLDVMAKYDEFDESAPPVPPVYAHSREGGKLLEAAARFGARILGR